MPNRYSAVLCKLGNNYNHVNAVQLEIQNRRVKKFEVTILFKSLAWLDLSVKEGAKVMLRGTFYTQRHNCFV